MKTQKFFTMALAALLVSGSALADVKYAVNGLAEAEQVFTAARNSQVFARALQLSPSFRGAIQAAAGIQGIKSMNSSQVADALAASARKTGGQNTDLLLGVAEAAKAFDAEFKNPSELNGGMISKAYESILSNSAHGQIAMEVGTSAAAETLASASTAGQARADSVSRPGKLVTAISAGIVAGGVFAAGPVDAQAATDNLLAAEQAAGREIYRVAGFEECMAKYSDQAKQTVFETVIPAAGHTAVALADARNNGLYVTEVYNNALAADQQLVVSDAIVGGLTAYAQKNNYYGSEAENKVWANRLYKQGECLFKQPK